MEDTKEEKNRKYSVMKLPFADDMHVHLRDDLIMKSVVPMVKKGGCNRVVVMPNVQPYISSCDMAMKYKQDLLSLDSTMDYMMTLYLSDQIQIDDLKNNAKASAVTGIKSYPKGVTTNSEGGVESYEKYYPLFREMERLNITLHIHGECPHQSPLVAEQNFMPVLHQLSRSFSGLRIVLEHVTSKAAVEEVKALQNVAATITPHHLEITSSDVLNDPSSFSPPLSASSAISSSSANVSNIKNCHYFCKPIAKTLEDKAALQQVILEGHPRFFLGSDSAPHLKKAKESDPPAAGVFTTPLIMAYLADTFDSLGCLDKLERFACRNAAEYFGLQPKSFKEGEECVILRRSSYKVPSEFQVEGAGDVIVPFKARETLNFHCDILPATP